MSVRVTTLPEGRLVIRQSSPLAARLFGLPFLAVGGWFLWQIASGIVEYVRAGAVAQLPSQIPGLLFILFFASLFGLPGLLLTFGSKQVLVDATRREVVEQINWVVYRRAVRKSLSAFSSIDVLHELGARRSSGSRVAMYNVYLGGGGRDDVLTGIFDSSREALAHARRVAEAASLPVRDRTDSVDEED